MSSKLTQNLTELVTVDTANDKIPIVDSSDPSELKYTVPDNIAPSATATVAGKVELATTAETETGTDATRAVTPDGLHDMTSLAGAAWFLDEDSMTANSAVKVPSQQSVKAYVDRPVFTTLNVLQLFAPRGFMINGKFTVTDTGSGIIIALKTLAGTDPSSSDPVYVRIGDTVRTISSALSVTAADGTNWFNAGSSELATKEIDYFVLLGYNATDGVTIGFSRHCVINQYGDFSTTSTNERYCKISTITNAASTDYYEVVGRFAATLSAGAGYTWSVPTYTAENLIQRPIYETRILTWVPTWTGYSVSPGGVYNYQLIGRRCYLFTSATTGTSNATTNHFTVPFMAKYGDANEARNLVGWGVNNSGNLTNPSRLNLDAADTNTFKWALDGAGNVWTASGTKMVNINQGYNYVTV